MVRKKLAVCLITYNHDRYITQAIESILMQEVDFEWEFIIADDCSSDNTTQIIKQYKERFPNLIQLIIQTVNVGPAENFRQLINAASSEYIAYIEGDDYWIDPLKLKKQVDFLDSNPECSIHSGLAKFSSDDKRNGQIFGNTRSKDWYSLADFITQNNLITAPTMYRNLEFKYPLYYSEIPFGDWFQYVMILHHYGGEAYVANEIYSVYRVHDKGTLKSLSKLREIELHFKQIAFVRAFTGIRNLSNRDCLNLNNYCVHKFEILIKSECYLKAILVILSNFKHCGLRVSLRKYLQSLNTILIKS